MAEKMTYKELVETYKNPEISDEDKFEVGAELYSMGVECHREDPESPVAKEVHALLYPTQS